MLTTFTSGHTAVQGLDLGCQTVAYRELHHVPDSRGETSDVRSAPPSPAAAFSATAALIAAATAGASPPATLTLLIEKAISALSRTQVGLPAKKNRDCNCRGQRLASQRYPETHWRRGIRVYSPKRVGICCFVIDRHAAAKLTSYDIGNHFDCRPRNRPSGRDDFQPFSDKKASGAQFHRR